MNSKKEVVKIYKAVQTAFSKDCENLLRKYAQQQTFSYKAFAAIWKSMYFSLVFAGRSSYNELRHYTEVFLFESKKHFLFATNIYIKTGAFYLMYGLYYKQPIIDYVKIRLTQDEFVKITDFINEIKPLKHIAPLYVYCKMMADDVFDFVYTQQVFAPDLRHLRENFIMEDTTFAGQDPSRKIEDSLTRLLENKDIALVNSEYQKALVEYKDDNQAVNLMVFKTNILDDLRTIMEECKPVISGPSGTSQMENIEELKVIEKGKGGNIGCKRTTIKQKAMDNKAAYRNYDEK